MVFIVKVPSINGMGRTKGCEKTGNAVLGSLKEIYVNEQGRRIDVKNLDLEEIHLDNSNLEFSNELIYKNAFEIYETKPKVFFIGGDHSISYSLARAFFDYCQNSEKEPCLIVFDAHADCVNLADRKFPTHEEWLRGLIEDGFPSENILLVGTRNYHKDELEFLKEKRIRIISMNQLLEDLNDTCEIIMEFTSGRELYVSIDIDVIDPVFAPATFYSEPGGLSSREFIYIIQRINKMKNLRAIDLVEINSEKDHKNFTVRLGAKILGEFL
ncbi:MAG: arginase family protein [archaeon]